MRRATQEFVSRPDRMFARNDATALAMADKYRGMRMPNLGLSMSDAADVLAYIDAQSYVVKAEASDKPKSSAHAGHKHQH